MRTCFNQSRFRGMPRFDNRGRPESVAIGAAEPVSMAFVAGRSFKRSATPQRFLFSTAISECNCTADEMESVMDRQFRLDTILVVRLGYVAAAFPEKTNSETFATHQPSRNSVTALFGRYASCICGRKEDHPRHRSRVR